MTREEINALIEKLDHEYLHESAEWQVNGTCYLKAFDLGKLIVLARLGASVMAPTEAEVEAMAWALGQVQFDNPAEVDYVEWSDLFPSFQDRLKAEALAALASLKDSANG